MTVRDFPRDCNVKDVRAFIGLAKLLSQIGEKRCRHRYTSHSPHPEEHMHVNNIRIFEHMHMNKTCIFVWTVVDEYKRFKSSHSFCYKSTIITSDPSPLIPVKYWHYHVSIIDHIGKLARWELRPGTINDNALSPFPRASIQLAAIHFQWVQTDTLWFQHHHWSISPKHDWHLMNCYNNWVTGALFVHIDEMVFSAICGILVNNEQVNLAN